jgi:hypothetical protein
MRKGEGSKPVIKSFFLADTEYVIGTNIALF